MSRLRSAAGTVARKTAPGLMSRVDESRQARAALRELRANVRRLARRVAELESEVQEARRLNRRIAELTDVVQELLIPLSKHDEVAVTEILERYGDGL